MKRILLLIVTISLFSVLQAQENTWNVYLKGQAVKSIAFENDSIWALTDSFLVRLDKVDTGKTYYTFPEIQEYTEYTQYHLKISREGTKWISLGNIIPFVNSLYSFNGGDWKKYNLPYDFWVLTSIEIDKSNCLWLTSTGLGASNLYKYDGTSFKKYTSDNSGLPYNSVGAVAADSKGNIWLGNTYWNAIDGGSWPPAMYLAKYDGENWTSFPGPSRYYGKIAFDNEDHLWIQGFIYESNDELFKLDLSDNSWIDYLTLDDNYVLEEIDKENKLWFLNGDNGIAVYNGSDWTFIHTSNSELPSNTVYQIAIDADGTKWIATENGLASLKLATAATFQLSPGEQPFSFYPNPAHNFIRLEFSSPTKASKIGIVDLCGRTLKELTANENITIIDLSDLTNGIYVLKVESGDGFFARKFIKQ